jgi:prophage regulatory protein
MIKVLRRQQVESVTGLSRSSIYSMMQNGIFPQPIKLTQRSVGWLTSEV